MSVDVVHAEYARKLPDWLRARTTISGGASAVKAAGETYLTRPTAMARKYRRISAVDPYELYLERAQFVDVPARTRLGISGMLNARPAEVTGDSDVTLETPVGPDGSPLSEVLSVVESELLTTGRVGVLVDTFGDAPYVTIYRAEDIRNWRADRWVDGVVPVLYVLRETESNWNGFEQSTSVIYRVLRLSRDPFSGGLTSYERAYLDLKPGTPITLETVLPLFGLYDISETGDPVYSQEVWRPVAAKGGATEYQIVDRIFPARLGGIRPDRIPFELINTRGCGCETGDVPLLPLVDLALARYRNSADLEHGLHFSALPTAWAAGFDLPEGESLVIGSGTAWVAVSADARAGYLEFSGAGLAAISAAMAEKDEQMARFGARILDPRVTTNETATAAVMRESGDHSATTAIAAAVSAGLTAILTTWNWWRLRGPITLRVRTKSSRAGLAGAELTALVSAYLSGAISFQTYFWNLQRAEVYADGVTVDDELALIEAGGPGKAPEPVERPYEEPEDAEDDAA
jgi:hypothetical protein